MWTLGGVAMKFNPVKRFPKPQNAAERPSHFAPPPPRHFGQNYDFNKKRKEAKRTLKNKNFSTTKKKKTNTNKTGKHDGAFLSTFFWMVVRVFFFFCCYSIFHFCCWKRNSKQGTRVCVNTTENAVSNNSWTNLGTCSSQSMWFQTLL